MGKTRPFLFSPPAEPGRRQSVELAPHREPQRRRSSGPGRAGRLLRGSSCHFPAGRGFALDEGARLWVTNRSLQTTAGSARPARCNNAPDGHGCQNPEDRRGRTGATCTLEWVLDLSLFRFPFPSALYPGPRTECKGGAYFPSRLFERSLGAHHGPGAELGARCPHFATTL